MPPVESLKHLSDDKLKEIINNWKSYTKEYVIIAVAVLEQRGAYFELDKMGGHSKDFMQFHKISSIEDFAIHIMRQYGLQQNNMSFSKENTNNKNDINLALVRSAGESIKNIGNLIILYIVAATVAIFFMITSGYRNVNSIYIIFSLVGTIFFIAILVTIYRIGNKFINATDYQN